MIFRGFQGGFQFRKFRMWIGSMMRFRYQIVFLAIILLHPLRQFSDNYVAFKVLDA